VSKICPRCGGSGPFGKNKSLKDGLSFYCRSCRNEKANVFYEKHIDQHHDQQRRRRLLFPEKCRESVRQAFVKNGHTYRQKEKEKNKTEEARARRRARNQSPARREKARLRYIANIDKRREEARLRKRLAYKKNPEKFRERQSRRRSAAAGKATERQILDRVKFFGGVCAYCQGPYEHLDHSIPLSKGGTHWPANLRPSCATCNMRKHTKIWQPSMAGPAHLP
jgi:hypothetical protein